MGVTFLFAYYSKDLPSPDAVVRREGFSTKIFDRNGKLLYDVFKQARRTPVKLEDVPLSLRQATIAIEDKNFYKHQGFDPAGYLRIVYNLVFRRRLTGGSTLTQQLVKNALLTPQRTVVRKIKEFILSVEIEKKFSKVQILQMYLNEAPYGGTAVGIVEAADTYFGKKVSELNLVESAVLAGLPQEPSRLTPFGLYPTAYQARTKDVLRRMREDGYITADQEKMAAGQVAQVNFASHSGELKAPHFVFYVKDILNKRYGESVVESRGLSVVTTLDLDLQEKAQAAVSEEIAKVINLKITNGAALVMNPKTGEILSMVGSRRWDDPNYDGKVNVVLSLRQPGSTIKPVTYVTGFKNGYTPSSMLMDVATTFPGGVNLPDYKPVNYDGKFHGPLSIRTALGSSINVPAVKMLALVGIKDMLSTAYDMGILSLEPTDENLQRLGLSVTLGGGEVRLLDLVSAYSSFANGGFRKDPVAILKVTDRFGNILYEYKDPNVVKNVSKSLNYPNFLLINGKRAINRDTAYLISHILLDNGARATEFGTSSSLVVNGHQAVSVKTGTTDDLRDNWTIGYTPNFMTLVWVGNNDNKPMNPYLVSGITGAAPIWNRVMQRVLKNQKDLWPQKPDTIIGLEVCDLTGLKPAINPDGTKSCTTRFEYFEKGTEPAVQGSLKQHIMVDKSTGDIAKPGQTDNVEDKEKTVVSDNFSTYCVDCTHDDKNFTTVPIK